MSQSRRSATADLFSSPKQEDASYSAKDIEVLEGLEPVRRRPGMYIGGTDDRALHHLAAEVIDNAMDEAVAGHADRIEVLLHEDGSLTVTDNGRGIPVDSHPKFKKKSALEVILTTLHSGGKFEGKAYQTSGGLHGVGISVVNALSDWLRVQVARDRQLWSQEYSRGVPLQKLEKLGPVQNRRGTNITFHPDPSIFGEKAHFKPARLYQMARSKAYLYHGVEIRWACCPSLLTDSKVPEKETFHFPGGLHDYLQATVQNRHLVAPEVFSGDAKFGELAGRVEWAVCWPTDGDGFCESYCNTVPTPSGGSHETGMRTALARSLKAYGEMVGNKRTSTITTDDVVDGAGIVLSLFIREPQFQGQTKERLSTPEATRLVEGQVKDHFDHWLSNDRQAADALLESVLERAEERLRRKQSRELKRKSATRKTQLPGKLTDCSRNSPEGTEIFLVEGDSAGGSAKQARKRETQAILPLRGKILNVVSASAEKLRGNQELRDMMQALGCGAGKDYKAENLRYQRVIIMTDADVDGAHIAALLMTFFFRQIPGLVADGRLFLAVPPLYRLSQGGKTAYAIDDEDRERLLREEFSGHGKVEVSRFKGLGEMPAVQLRETTMDPERRTLLQVELPSGVAADQSGDARKTRDLVEQLMGRKPEARFAFIQDNARFVEDVDI